MDSQRDSVTGPKVGVRGRLVLFAYLILHVLLLGLTLVSFPIVGVGSWLWGRWLKLRILLWHRPSDIKRLADHRFFWLDRLAQRAYNRGELDKAERLANELLQLAIERKGDWNYGNAIHHGHRILGLVALKRGGDREEAKRQLLASANGPSSPQLSSFGPRMSLAKALLDCGEHTVVLQYLMACRFLWQDHGSRIDSWSAEIKNGRVPNFGANLYHW